MDDVGTKYAQLHLDNHRYMTYKLKNIPIGSKIVKYTNAFKNNIIICSIKLKSKVIAPSSRQILGIYSLKTMKLYGINQNEQTRYVYYHTRAILTMQHNKLA